MAREWNEKRLRRLAETESEAAVRMLLDDLIGVQHPASVFGQSFYEKVWRCTPNRHSLEAGFSKASAFSKAAAAYLLYSK